MILYHGSTVEVQQPRILKSEIGRDFGFAFYTTDIRTQAERWARRRAMIESRRTKIEVQPVVSVYEWDEDDAKQSAFCGSTAQAWIGWSLSLPAAAGQTILTIMILSKAKLQMTTSAKRFPMSCRGSCAGRTRLSVCGLNKSIIKSRSARKLPCTHFIFRTAIFAGV